MANPRKSPVAKKAGKKPVKKKVAKKAVRRGRPGMYSVRLTNEICRELYESDDDKLPKSLRAICRKESMPNISTVCDWLNKHEDFAERYARARELRKEALVDRMMHLSQTALNNAHGAPGTGIAGARVQAIKLEIDTIKWVLSKEYSHDYGDRLKQEITGADGGAIKTESEFTVDSDAEAMIKKIALKRHKLQNGNKGNKGNNS
jgi:hypothetical protein